ncbi:DUF6314 family protein [Salipiger abyssi]|uniref:DUF6314 domain-containing protein n=1 Tax=Salipiger abyssi TaxID=1250539 RepID=A0A1P8UVE3_9RHOB|nr:DUF6314 family protein [Salipiger abyssi]APZ53365.1 hypothetical protein Ga0080574_TMP3031 [Salipiger abyssi]
MANLDAFFGEWELERQIRHHDGGIARFEGTALWVPKGMGALYIERGTLVMPQARYHSERRYLWDRALRVYFEDGRFFHQVPAEGGQAEHRCPPDTYAVFYDFGAWPVWTTRWHVSGPRKDYVMLSRYVGAAAPKP